MKGQGAGSAGEQPGPAGERLSSRLIDASLVAMLAASPLLASRGGREIFAVLAVIAVGGVAALYQRGSRAKRLSRCAWLIFFAISISVYLAVQALTAAGEAGEIALWAALAVKWGLVIGLAGWGFMLVLERRGPHLGDAFDWGAALTVGILVAAGVGFAALGDDAAVGALATPCAVVGMHFVVREQCRSLHKARRLAQVAMVSAILALVGWAFSA
ncbi:MAG: hypothetical protein Q8R92_19135 [Deltaproteobacteria bacterium]|nr:hypothetical protein [Deltaproteobacteria bacterium]